MPHGPWGLPHPQPGPDGGESERELAGVRKVLSARRVWVLWQCSHAMGLSASAMGRRASVVSVQSSQAYS